MPGNNATVTATYRAAPEPPQLVSAISITGGTGIAKPGGTLQLIAKITPSNATNQTVRWSVVAGGAYAKISAGGLLTALADGTVTVRAEAQDGSGAFKETTITITGQSKDRVVPKPISYHVMRHCGVWYGKGAAHASVDADHHKFVRLLKGGVVVKSANYTIGAGSTVITFTEAYLKTLPAGVHWFVAEYTDGRSDPIQLRVAAGSSDNNQQGKTATGKGKSDLAYTGTATAMPTLALALLLTLSGGLLVVFRRRGRVDRR